MKTYRYLFLVTLFVVMAMFQTLALAQEGEATAEPPAFNAEKAIGEVWQELISLQSSVSEASKATDEMRVELTSIKTVVEEIRKTVSEGEAINEKPEIPYQTTFTILASFIAGLGVLFAALAISTAWAIFRQGKEHKRKLEEDRKSMTAEHQKFLKSLAEDHEVEQKLNAEFLEKQKGAFKLYEEDIKQKISMFDTKLKELEEKSKKSSGDEEVDISKEVKDLRRQLEILKLKSSPPKTHISGSFLARALREAGQGAGRKPIPKGYKSITCDKCGAKFEVLEEEYDGICPACWAVWDDVLF